MAVAQPAGLDAPTARILIVDDIAANRLALGAVLEPLGHQVFEARSGEEALKATLQNDFAVILMDVQMPGLDGFGTVELLRQRDRTRYTPVIFVTAFGDTVSTRGFALGAIDFITKPFDPDILRGRIGALCTMWQRGKLVEAQAAALRTQAVAAERDRVAREAAEQASRMKDEFLAIVSHELRTPLNAILGWAELLAGTENMPLERIQHGIETIARNARMQARLIEDLLDVSRIIAGKLKISRAPTDLGAMARRAAETVAPTANAKNVGLEVVIDPGEHEIMGDAARLQQVVWNLLSNALKFSNPGAHVTMTLKREGGAHVLRVVDHGIGIEADFLPFVFDRFRQADHAGTRQHGGLGLGLAIARRIVELHGGTISARSEGLGKGATFTVRLPVKGQESAPMAEVPVEKSGTSTGQYSPVAVALPAPRLDGLRVLFVDDEPDARELVAMVLTDAGAEVHTAASVADALVKLGRERFDVLVSDIGMPGEDGYSLMRKLLVREVAVVEPVPPAIALSAFTSAQDRERALAAGFTTHLGKPLDAPRLIAFVDRLARR